MTRLRWNPRRRRWEFYEEAWGGWCVLRVSPSDRSRAMTFLEGIGYLIEREAARLADLQCVGVTARHQYTVEAFA